MKQFKTLFITILLLFITLEILSDKNKDDKTIILPTTYGWIADGVINIPVHAWIFDLEKDSFLRNSLIHYLKEYPDTADSEEKNNLEQRIRYFTADNKHGKIISLNLSGENFTLPVTSPNGHAYKVIKIKNQPETDSANKQLSFSTLPLYKQGKTFSGRVTLIGSKGYSVISDIDDTIKVSNVLNKKELVKNTFLKRFAPVAGMSELYTKLKNKGFAFHYISGSPWQLYPAIENFLNEEKFPEGSVELKLFRLKDKSFINFLTADQLTYKTNAIKTLLDRFTGRKFILIGDSGEKDPEVYSEIAHIYKDRIKYIFIRDAGNINGNETRINSIEEKAGNVKIIIFKKAEELEPYIANL